MKVSFFLRKKTQFVYSVENIFDGLSNYFILNNEIEFDKNLMPENRVTIKKIFKNLYFAFKNRGKLNHIFGDIHYVTIVLKPKRTILTILDCVILTSYKKNSLKFWFFWFFWYKIPTMRCKIITTISEKSKKEIMHFVGIPENKIKVIPVHYDLIYLENNKEFQTLKPSLLHIGIAPNKNLSRVIESINGLNCHLEIVGKPTENEIQKLEEYNVDYNCSFNISQTEMRLKYQQCDILIFASTYEGFGMPIIEAQATGRPVITSNIEPMLSVAGTGACFVDPYQISEIRNAIIKISTDEKYREQIVKLGLKNKKRFNIEEIANQYIELYKSIN